MRRAVLLAAAVLGLLAAPAIAPAQDQPPRASLPDIEDEVMCPVCGTPLNVASEAPQAQRQRAYIRELIAQGKTKEEIKDALVAEFGSAVLALPQQDEGVGWAAYLVPIAALGLVTLGLMVALPRWRARRAAAPGAGGDRDPGAREPTALSAGDRARLEEELARFDR